MHKLGLNKAVGYYCSKAGGRGRKLLEELSNTGNSTEEKQTGIDANDDGKTISIDGLSVESGKSEPASKDKTGSV